MRERICKLPNKVEKKERIGKKKTAQGSVKHLMSQFLYEHAPNFLIRKLISQNYPSRY